MSTRKQLLVIEILVLNDKDEIVGKYQTPAAPRVGERLDANNGSWIVERVQHDIAGELYSESRTVPSQKMVVVYVVKCAR